MIRLTTNMLVMILISITPGMKLQKKKTHQKKTQSHVSTSQQDNVMQANACPATANVSFKENIVTYIISRRKTNYQKNHQVKFIF